MKKGQPYPPVDKKKLLPKDRKVREWLEKGGRPGAYEDFLKLVELAATTPASKLKPSKASRKRSDEANPQT
jgi:hypothetical protein